MPPMLMNWSACRASAQGMVPAIALLPHHALQSQHGQHHQPSHADDGGREVGVYEENEETAHPRLLLTYAEIEVGILTHLMILGNSVKRRHTQV